MTRRLARAVCGAMAWGLAVAAWGEVWCGESFVVVNGSWFLAGKTPYEGASSYEGATVGTGMREASVGGELLVWPDRMGTRAEMQYRIRREDGSEAVGPTVMEMHYAGAAEEGRGKWQTGGAGFGTRELVAAHGLGPGTYLLEVWFRAEVGGEEAWDSNGGRNYVGQFSVGE